jgi:hypothetical protein
MKSISILMMAIVSTVISFSAIKSYKSCSLLMAGGKSQAEKLLTKKGMFKDLKQKLNTAAEIPGFFEVGDGKPVSHSYYLLLIIIIVIT